MEECEPETAGERPDAQHGTPRKHCTSCDTVIETTDWYPVTKERDEDGTLQFYPFCSEACRDAWLDASDD